MSPNNAPERTKVHLPSGFLPKLRIDSTVTVKIGPHGQIHDKPQKFYASQRLRDFVIWEFTNASGEPITVTVTDFLRKADCSDAEGTAPVSPFIWQTSDSVNLADGQTGNVIGQVDPNYKRQNANGDDCVSYSIQVESQTVAIDYDPDGDIKP